VRAGIDYHVEFDGHYYAVPFTLRGEQFELRATATTVEVFHQRQRLVAYPRSFERGRHSTRTEFMPKSHQAHLEWSPARITRWAGTLGRHTQGLVEAILADRPHPEQGYRSCLGILRLAKRYGESRLEAACERALAVRARSYRHVESILKHGLDRLPAPEERPDDRTPVVHPNLRGRDYYR
jgi:transposase